VTCRVLGLLPFLVKGARSLEVFRAMPERGIHVTVAYAGITTAYEPDGMADFVAGDRLIDLSRAERDESLQVVDEAIVRRGIDVIVQIGATPLYSCLPHWKERHPELGIADILYNEIGHTLNHFLYERCIDTVIVETENMRRYVLRASEKASPVVEVISGGVDLDWFAPRRRPLAADSPITVGYIGRMSPEKNPLGFVELAERLTELDPDLAFRLVGQGPQAAEVEQRLRVSPHAGRIVYTGYAEELRQALYEIDVLVLPSKLDGQPAIVMEANACGIPVVAAPVGGVPELIEEGANGYLVHPEETDRIHGLLSTWKQSPESFGQLRQSAREYACRMFGREHMLDNYARVFRRLATSSKTTTAAPAPSQ
jgi:glycosyltransferase involved in cell wall biosynthesis